MKLDYDGVVSICDAHGICLPVDCVEMVVAIIEHATAQQPDHSGDGGAFHLLASLVDAWDDQENNEPEARCYAPGTWREVLDEARALIASSDAQAASVPQGGGAEFEAWLRKERGRRCDFDANAGSWSRKAWDAALASKAASIAVAEAVGHAGFEELLDAYAAAVEKNDVFNLATMNETIRLAGDARDKVLAFVEGLRATPPAPIASTEEVPTLSEPATCLICNSTGNSTPCAYPTEINRQQAARIERLRKGLFEARDAMRVMSSWVKKSDPAGHSWAVRMVDRANDILSHAPTVDTLQAAQPVLTDEQITELVHNIERKLDIYWFIPDDSETHLWRTINTEQQRKFVRALLAVAQPDAAQRP